MAAVRVMGTLLWRTLCTTRDNRVTRQAPCQWCGGTKYCLRFDDGNSFCRTIGDASQRTDAFMGGYLHRADTSPTLTQRPVRLLPTPSASTTPATLHDDAHPASTPRAESAPPDVLHAVYSDLLARCPLSAAHRALLTGPKHGLDERQVATYGTLPNERNARDALVAALIATHGAATLLSAPGFVPDDSCGGVTLAPLAGILMPRRDLAGRLTGFQVRSDRPDANPRYLWLSSASAKGPSSGSAPHIAQPSEIRDARTVYIVEGIKKADIIAGRTGCVAMSINGVGTWRAAEDVLDELTTRGVDVCIIALDRDSKPEAITDVERSRQRLAAAAVARGYATRIASWDSNAAKGPDDLLLTGLNFTIERYRPSLEIVPPLDNDNDVTDGEGPPRYGVPTLAEARALSHETLARRHVALAERAYASNVYLDLIGRVSKHAAVITPEDDPTAKRTRPVLTPTDRMCAVNAIFGIRAAHKGAISPAPVALYRAAIAANGTSVGTASSSMSLLARVGILNQDPDEDEEGRRLYALPAVMPGDIPAAQVLAFDSTRRTTERRRACAVCGGALERTTRVRVACKTCGDIVTDKTQTVTLSDYDDDAVGVAAAADAWTAHEAQGTPPVANCNTYVTSTDHEGMDMAGRYNVLGVAICNDPPTDPHSAATSDLDDVDDVPPVAICNDPPPTTLSGVG